MESTTSKRVSAWILEFLLRNPDAEELAKKALAVLPLPDDDPRLKRTVLLRTIECEVSDAAVSESTLEALELIQELDSRQGVHALDSLKAAYCAVAVECTARLLVAAGGKPGAKYLSALKRIWRGRVGRLEGAEEEKEGKKSCLWTSDLRRWWDEVEAAIWDAGVCERLMGLNTRNDAVASVRAYLREAWALAGNSVIGWAVRLRDEEEEEVRVSGEGEPTDRGMSLSAVIELAEKTGLQGLGGGEGDGDGVRNKVVDDVGVLPDPQADLVVNDTPASNAKEIHGTKVVVRSKHVALHKRLRGPVRISDIEDSETDTAGRRCDSLPTPEVNKVQEALKSSSLVLLTVVTDPLPEAVQVAETVISDLATKNVIHESNSENQSVREADAANISVDNNDKSTENAQSRDANLGNPSCSRQNQVPRRSLMDRNSTACTLEWNDSIDGSPEAKLKGKTRLHLPSPKKRVVSPLKKYEPMRLSKRRKVKRWSLLEEDTLRTGVLKFGKGNWKLILNSYRDVFEERTEVDLKDKWRNMTK